MFKFTFIYLLVSKLLYADDLITINLPETETIKTIKVESLSKQSFILVDKNKKLTRLSFHKERGAFSAYGIKFSASKSWKSQGKHFLLQSVHLLDINQSVIILDISDFSGKMTNKLRIILEFKGKEKLGYWLKNIQRLKNNQDQNKSDHENNK